MFESIRSFLAGFNHRTGSAPAAEDDPRVAVAALMFHIIEADGVRDPEEGALVKELLSQTYGLQGPALEMLAAQGEAADSEAIDLYAFTSVIKRHVDYAERVELVRLLWELVYADGEVHELEDNLLWRIAELIGVERADRLFARQQVTEVGSGR